MRTALDTNILSAILTQENRADAARIALLQARRNGSLVLSGAAYAELVASPGATRTVIETVLSATKIQADFTADEVFWFTAGQAYKVYTERRRASGGGLPRRILADFVIGAHASLRADALITLDPQHYRLSFPDLKLVVPR